MTKKKLPNYKVEDLVRKDGRTFEIINIIKEPTVKIKDLSKIGSDPITVLLPELTTYEHYPHSTRRPPRAKKAKPVVVEAKILTETEPCEGSITTTPPTAELLKGIMERQHQDWAWAESQAPQNGAAEAKVDLSTFKLQVKGEGRWQHKMTLAGKTASGKDLKPTLLRLLEEFGITGSDAEVETALVLHPESEGRNRMLDILKGNAKG